MLASHANLDFLGPHVGRRITTTYQNIFRILSKAGMYSEINMTQIRDFHTSIHLRAAFSVEQVDDLYETTVSPGDNPTLDVFDFVYGPNVTN